jgi:hypothetical protein
MGLHVHLQSNSFQNEYLLIDHFYKKSYEEGHN